MLAKESDMRNGVVDLEFAPAAKAGDGDLERMIGIEILGEGAPLTS